MYTSSINNTPYISQPSSTSTSTSPVSTESTTLNKTSLSTDSYSFSTAISSETTTDSDVTEKTDGPIKSKRRSSKLRPLTDDSNTSEPAPKETTIYEEVTSFIKGLFD
jgi:hypothetical protein